MITVARESGYADRIRNYQVILDDEVIGEIADGLGQSFDVKVGAHILY